MLRLIRVLMVLVLFIQPTVVRGCCVNAGSFDTRNSSTRVWFPNSLPSFVKQAVRSGMALWNDPECNKTGYDFPKFVESNPAEAELYVLYKDELGPENPSTGATVCGEINSEEDRGDITLYTKFLDSSGILLNCPDTAFILKDIVAHELGHYLGLGESACLNFIMGPMSFSVSGGVATHFPSREIQAAECAKAEELNFTRRELCSLYGCGNSNQDPLDDYQGDNSGTQSGGSGTNCRWNCVQYNWGLVCDLHC